MPTDSELWDLIKMYDDERAFSLLFNRYASKIYSKSYSYLRDAEMCEEIVHDIFLTIWSNRKTLQVNSFSAYLTTASRYRVYKQVRQSKIAKLDYKEDVELFSKNTAENSGLNKLIYNDLEDKLDKSLSSLPKRCREVFLLSRKDLMTNDEIALKLGISKRTVENQLTQALKHLRTIYKDLPIMFIIIQLGRNL